MRPFLRRGLAIGLAIPVLVFVAVSSSTPDPSQVGFMATGFWRANLPDECSSPPQGPIGKRWRELGGKEGALGCPTGPARNVPGRRGQTQEFANGAATWSPEQGENMVVAAYLRGFHIVLNWRSTAPYHYDKFIVIWDLNGVRQGQRDVKAGPRDRDHYYVAPRDRGTFHLKPEKEGRYRFAVEGCLDPKFFSGSKCRQKWTAPVEMDYEFSGGTRDGVPSQDYGCPAGAPLAEGEIGFRWRDFGAGRGPLGCPVTTAEDHGEKGKRQRFANGDIVWSPRHGERMTVTAYAFAGHISIHLGPMGRKYDFVQALLERDGRQIKQIKIEEHLGVRSWRLKSTTAGQYTVGVQGCDKGILGSDCTMWTIPVRVAYKGYRPPPPPAPMADISISDVHHGASGTPPGKADQLRLQRAADMFACRKLPDLYGAKVDEDLALVLLARMRRVKAYGPQDACPGEPPNRLVVNEFLRWIEPGALGTDSELPCPPYYRHGDYDTFLKGLVPILYRYPDLVDSDVFARARDALINISGSMDYGQLRVSACGFPGSESENHILMIVTSQYLGNQLRYRATRDPKFHNNDNGLEDWLLGFLQVLAKHDFLEYNSRKYQRYSMHALMNLYDFAESPRMRDAARIILDYTTTKFAVSSDALRRAGPFRRLRVNNDKANRGYYEHNSDSQTKFFLQWTGLSDYTGHKIRHEFAGQALIAGLSDYRPPHAAHKISTGTTKAEHRFYHGRRPRMPVSDVPDPGVEIYSRSPSFMITAGGVWTNSGYRTDQWRKFKDVGLVQSTTLMPSRLSVIYQQLIRFTGRVRTKKPGDRYLIHTCVSSGFACGIRLIVPKLYHPCLESKGRWQFIDGTCILPRLGPLGFHLAIGTTGDVGFWYAVEANSMEYAPFRDQTIRDNRRLPSILRPTETYTFHAPDGTSYTFRLTPSGKKKDKYANLVIANNGVNLPRIINWPLASGRHLSSDGHSGLLRITAPNCRSSLKLDFTDVDLPQITESGC